MQRASAGPSALSGSLACRLGLRWCPLGTSAPKGGGKTELSANFWLRIDLVPSLGAATSRWDAVQQSTGAAAVTERARCYRPGKAQATKGCQAVSLAFSHALRVYKGKVVGLCPTTRKLFEKSLTKNFKLASLGHYSSHNTFSVSTSSCFSIPHSCAAFTASCRCSSTLRSCSSFKNSVFFPATKLPFPVRE